MSYVNALGVMIGEQSQWFGRGCDRNTEPPQDESLILTEMDRLQKAITSGRALCDQVYEHYQNESIRTSCYGTVQTKFGDPHQALRVKLVQLCDAKAKAAAAPLPAAKPMPPILHTVVPNLIGGCDRDRATPLPEDERAILATIKSLEANLARKRRDCYMQYNPQITAARATGDASASRAWENSLADCYGNVNLIYQRLIEAEVTKLQALCAQKAAAAKAAPVAPAAPPPPPAPPPTQAPLVVDESSEVPHEPPAPMVAPPVAPKTNWLLWGALAVGGVVALKLVKGKKS
jgi:hypothetical protein